MIPWEKIGAAVLTAIGGALCAYGIPVARKAVKNWNKTDIEIASEELDAALKRVEDAHASAKAAKLTEDPSDDVTAAENLKNAEKLAEIAKAHKDRARRLAALSEGIVDGLSKEPSES